MTYVYACSAGHPFESPFNTVTQCPEHFGTSVRRNYRAEGVSFGVVPGAFRDLNSTTMFDSDALKDQGISLSRDEVEDKRSDARKAISEFVSAE